LLSKPLGTGILMTAFKRDRLAIEYYTAAVRWMAELNATAARMMLKYEVHAATDITGFGLAGHATRMADGSGVTLVIEESDLPLLPGVLELSREGMTPGGGKRNREFFGAGVKVSEEIAEEIADIVFDPQTSGGLLITLAASEAHSLLADLQRSGNTEAAIIGRVTPRGRFSIELV
jgi:selenide,water dikinase